MYAITCHSSSFQKKNGFSLIELLVVMLIIAVLAAGVSLVVNPSGSTAKQLNKAGDQLFQQMSYARDEALVLNTVVGFDFIQQENDLEFSRAAVWKKHEGYYPESQSPRFVTMTDPLTRYELPENFQWELTQEGDALELSLDQLLAGDEEDQPPEIFFEYTGEVTAFTLTLFPSEESLQSNPEDREQRYLIKLDERGELVRYRVGEAEEL